MIQRALTKSRITLADADSINRVTTLNGITEIKTLNVAGGKSLYA